MHHSRNRSFWNKLLISLWSAATLIEEEATTTPAMSKPDLSSSCVDRDRSRSPAVCRKSRKGHQCWIALAEEEMSYIREKEILQKTWFGEGQSIAVKNTLEHAVWAFRQCKNGATPKFVMVFHLPPLTSITIGCTTTRWRWHRRSCMVIASNTTLFFPM